MNGSNIIK